MVAQGAVVPQEKISENSLARLYLGQEDGGEKLLVYALRRSLAENSELVEKLHALSAALSVVSDPALARHVFFRAGQGKAEWADAGCSGVSLALVQKLLEGRELELQPAPVLRLFEDLARALEALHGAGLSFGFLGPEHVWLGEDGQALLWASGVEAALLSIKSLAQGQLRGRRQHLAPEITRGRPPAPAADVYSMASLAYFFLTGRAPGAESSPSLSTRHQALVPPSHLNRKLPFACDAVFVKALSPNPSARPASGGELAEALRKLRAALQEGKDTSREQLAELARSLMQLKKQRGLGAVDFSKESEPAPSPEPLNAASPEPPEPDVPPPEETPVKEATQKQALDALYQENEPDTSEQLMPEEEKTPAEVAVPKESALSQPKVRQKQVSPPAPAQKQRAPAEVSSPHDTQPFMPAAEPVRKNRRVWLWPAGAGVLFAGAVILWLSAGRETHLPGEQSAVGFVSVTSSSECRITIDGLEQGLCPMQFKTLPAGRHRLVVRSAAGRVLLEQEISIQAGDHHRFHVTEPEPPRLDEQPPPVPAPVKKPTVKKWNKKTNRRKR